MFQFSKEWSKRMLDQASLEKVSCKAGQFIVNSLSAPMHMAESHSAMVLLHS